jgi:GAF domain-containing protein
LKMEKKALYKLLLKQIPGVLEGEKMYIPALANVASLLNNTLPEVNWAGFYLMHRGMLLLGPFMGNPACVRIEPGKGVCGAAAKEKQTQLVKDVHQFPGHIACDSASNSEIVVPIFKGGNVLGVLDIDSPVLNRFDEVDREGLEAIVKLLEETILWESHSLA